MARRASETLHFPDLRAGNDSTMAHVGGVLSSRTIELNFAGFICADRIASTRLFARGLGYIPSGSTVRTFPMTPARRRARRPRYDRYLFIVRICIRDGDLFLFRIISNRSALPRGVLRKQYAWQLIG